MSSPQIQIPDKLTPVFSPARGKTLYRAAYGGRGSGKSMSFALMASVFGYVEPLRVLCVREFQSSIRESFHAELRSAIDTQPFLQAHYDVGVDYLRGANGTEFIFRGLRRNTQSIKSLAKIDLTIVEEAEDVPEPSWLDLEATVFRQPKSELWAIWNPCKEGSPVDLRFRRSPPDKAVIAEINHGENPFFPPNMETLRQREQERLDPDTYAHVWDGAYLRASDAQILRGKVRVEEFTPGNDWDGPYFGADWGFSTDPTAAVKCWIHDDTLYVEHEAGGVGVDIDATPALLTQGLPDVARHVLRGDNARPETISYLQRNGLPNTVPADKWSGSVEDGIAHLRGYKAIAVHPRCKETVSETRLYSYKRDRLTNDVLPVVVDAHNHYIDAIRYALAPLIKQRQPAMTALQVRGL